MGIQYRKTKMVLNFRKDKPVVYKIAQVGMPVITFKQLVNECSVSCGVNSSQTKAVIDALLNRLVHYMEIGHLVKMGEFGSFKPTFRSKTTRSIDDADVNTVTKKLIRFYPGKDFRDMLNDLTIENAAEALNDEEEQG